MNCMGLCILGVVVTIAGANPQRLDLLDTGDFPSKFLGKTENIEGLMDLMRSHFNTALDYLFASKYYGSQYVERPGMAKLLSEQSDRHWEEGMDVLKKYLQLGGNTTDIAFLNSIYFSSEVLEVHTGQHGNTFISSTGFTFDQAFSRLEKAWSKMKPADRIKNDLPSQTEASHVKYGVSVKRVMEASRGLVNAVTELHHASTLQSGGHGDADVAHFLQEKAEEESEVARKMAGYYITLQKMDASGIAVALFDKNL